MYLCLDYADGTYTLCAKNAGEQQYKSPIEVEDPSSHGQVDKCVASFESKSDGHPVSVSHYFIF